MIDEHDWSEIDRIPLDLLRLQNYNPIEANREAEDFGDLYLSYVQRFSRSPQRSMVTLGWITNLLNFYSKVEPVTVADRFFSQIDVSTFPPLYPARSLSHLLKFVELMLDYIKRLEPTDLRTSRLERLFNSVDLQPYAQFINTSLQEKIVKVTKKDYTSESEVTWSSLIKNTANIFFRASNLTGDEEVRNAIREKISEFFSLLDIQILGQLMELLKKDIGPVVRVLDMLRKAHFVNNQLAQMRFLSEFDFERLALSYNQIPIGGASLASFCSRYLVSQSLSTKWEAFFHTISFEPNVKFNFVQSISVLKVLTKCLRNNPYDLQRLLLRVDFWHIGSAARGRNIIQIGDLMEYLTKTSLPVTKYRDMINALGVDELKRVASTGNQHIRRHLLIVLKYKCKYNPNEVEWITLPQATM